MDTQIPHPPTPYPHCASLVGEGVKTCATLYGESPLSPQATRRGGGNLGVGEMRHKQRNVGGRTSWRAKEGEMLGC